MNNTPIITTAGKTVSACNLLLTPRWLLLDAQTITDIGDRALKIFEGTKIPLLSKALQAYSKRNNVISSNIANIGTPGYHTQRVAFEEELSSVMEGTALSGVQTNERHLTVGAPSMTELSSQIINVEESAGDDPLASGVNNVDIDKEMAEMAKNQIRFRFAARMISDTFRGIQKSIRGQA